MTVRPLIVGALALLTMGCDASTTGVVVGGIRPCFADPPRPEEFGPIPLAPGTVTVRRGTVTWKQVDPHSSQAVLPVDTVTSETVATGQQYIFALAPGKYVLVADDGRWAEVTVEAGRSTAKDIPNGCR